MKFIFDSKLTNVDIDEKLLKTKNIPKTEILFTIPDEHTNLTDMGYHDWRFFFSNNNKRFAYKIAFWGSEDEELLKHDFFIIDGEVAQKGALASTFIFSPNSQHFAYIVIKDDYQFVVLDGKEQEKYNIRNGRGIFNLIFSPNSHHFAYIVIKDDHQFVVLDGDKQGEYSSISNLIFSPDSQHFAYIAEENGHEFVVLNGKKHKKYGSIHSLIFSPNSHHFAYIVIKDDHQFVVLDGDKQGEYSSISNLIFSPNSQQLAYVAREEDHQFVVLDGKEQKKFDFIVPGSVVFSPDSNRFAYRARKDNQKFVVLDGEEKNKRDLLPFSSNKIFFSPDSKTVAYFEKDSNGEFLVVDGKKKSDYYYDTDFFTFNPSGTGYAYAVNRSWGEGEEGVVFFLKEREMFLPQFRISRIRDIHNLRYFGDNHLVYNLVKENNVLMIVEELE